MMLRLICNVFFVTITGLKDLTIQQPQILIDESMVSMEDLMN